ncbi:expressed protein [Phakopsora pachyrhizi]|uniref:Expressed protein n=1 Tax=Phakopsora pachyrhizi TaxID=170000 RepID=A0AAV0AHI1_PHAPC|nr:expressed protein [Phakopsora pachyrhizi]
MVDQTTTESIQRWIKQRILLDHQTVDCRSIRNRFRTLDTSQSVAQLSSFLESSRDDEELKLRSSFYVLGKSKVDERSGRAVIRIERVDDDQLDAVKSELHEVGCVQLYSVRLTNRPPSRIVSDDFCSIIMFYFHFKLTLLEKCKDPKRFEGLQETEETSPTKKDTLEEVPIKERRDGPPGEDHLDGDNREEGGGSDKAKATDKRSISAEPLKEDTLNNEAGETRTEEQAKRTDREDTKMDGSDNISKGADEGKKERRRRLEESYSESESDPTADQDRYHKPRPDGQTGEVQDKVGDKVKLAVVRKKKVGAGSGGREQSDITRFVDLSLSL